MKKFHEVISLLKSLSVGVNGTFYKLDEVQEDYIKLSRVDDSGLTDRLYIPLHAISHVIENNFKKGHDRDVTYSLVLK